MIRIYIPGMYDSDFSSNVDMRLGDAQIIDDGVNYLVIDGACGAVTTRLIKRLKARGIKTPYLLLTHPHYDHYFGLRKIIADSYFKPKMLYCQDPSTLRSGSNTNTLKTIISEAKAKGITVKYLKHGDHIVHGDIDFYVYREQPAYNGNLDAYYNDGSLCTWFSTIGYWTSGDGCERIYDMCKKVGAKPKFFKLPHHGNNCPKSQAEGMKSLGANLCWDNDYSTKITEFLRYGRNRCIQAGITFIGIHGDINVVACSGNVAVYKGSKVYKYKCGYKKKTTLKTADLQTVIKVLEGKYGNADARITALIDAGYYPGSVQTAVNTLIKLIKG